MKVEMDMTKGNLFKKILIFTIPLILSSLLQIIYQFADNLVVGKFCGDDALSAVGSNASITNLMINIAVGLSIGASASLAKAYGKGDKEKAFRVVHTGIALSLILGVFVTIAGMLLSHKILVLMDSPEGVLDLATTYLVIYFAGSLFNIFYNFGAGLLRGVGDTFRPLIILFISGVTNVGLNLLFVIAFNLGVAGVAWATVISQGVSAILVLICLIKNEGYAKLFIKKIGFYKDALIDILVVGIPCGIQSSLFSISNIMIQSSVNSFGNEVLAGNTASYNLEHFIYVGMNSFSHTAITFTSQNLGAKKIKNVKKVLLYCLIDVLMVAFTLGIVALIFDEKLLGLYTDNQNVISNGVIRLHIFSITYFLCGIMDTLNGTIRGLGKATYAMIITLVGVCGIRIVWLNTYFRWNRTYSVLMYSYPLTWSITSIALIILLIISYKRGVNNEKSYNL